MNLDMCHACGMRNYRKVCSKFSEADGFNGWVIAKVEINNLSDDAFDTTCVEKCVVAKKRKRFALLETSWEIESANSVKAVKSDRTSCKMRMYLVKPSESDKKDPDKSYKKISDDSGKKIQDAPCKKDLDKIKNATKIYDESHGRQNDDGQYISFTKLYSKSYTAQLISEFTKDAGDDNSIHKGENPLVPGLLMLEDLLKKISKDKGHFSITFEKPVTAGQTISVCEYYKDGKRIIEAFRECSVGREHNECEQETVWNGVYDYE